MKIVASLIVSTLLFCIFVSVPTYVTNKCNIFSFPYNTWLGLPWKEVPCTYSGFMWGKSIIEKSSSWNIDSKRNIEKRRQAIDKFKSEGCTLYFDGCNNCTKDKDSFSCTLMACSQIKEPRCLSYSEITKPIPAGNENNSVNRGTFAP